MSGVDVGEPISSSGFAMKTTLPRASGARARTAASACSPARSPAFMSVTPGPVARPSAIRNGRAAAVPGGKTVSRWRVDVQADFGRRADWLLP